MERERLFFGRTANPKNVNQARVPLDHYLNTQGAKDEAQREKQ
jgi:hypothetical protein